MKSLIVIFLLLFSTVDVSAYQVFGGGAAGTLEGENGAFYLDLANSTGDLPADAFVNYSAEFGSLHQEENAASTYNLSTSFMTWTSMNESDSSSGITSSISTHDITVGPAGVYDIFFHASFEGSSGDEIEIAVFLNETTVIDEIVRTQGKGATHFPVFVNLSVGTFDTFSTVDRLLAADADLITVNEIGGATPGFIIDFIFDNVISPLEIEFDNVGYDGAGGHLVECEVWNVNLSQWDDCRVDTGDFPHTGSYGVTTAHLRGYDFPDPNADYVNGGEVKVRVNHTSGGTGTHDMIFDKVFLTDGFSGAVIASKNITRLNNGDKISLKIKNGIDGIINIKHMGLKLDRLGL